MGKIVDLDTVEFKKSAGIRKFDKGFNAGVSSCVEALKNAPTVDVVSVLEDIKYEICNGGSKGIWNKDYCDALIFAKRVLEKHIKELKRG